VELFVSPLYRLGGLLGYHTSVFFSGIEMFFTPTGIRAIVVDAQAKDSRTTKSPSASTWSWSSLALEVTVGRTASSFSSHCSLPKRIVVGSTDMTSLDLLEKMQPHFMPGTYDVLRKNCSSFSDCALWYLCGKRLDRRYCAMEKRCPQLPASMLSLGKYAANDAASGFKVESVIAAIQDSAAAKAADSRCKDESRVSAICDTSARQASCNSALEKETTPWMQEEERVEDNFVISI